MPLKKSFTMLCAPKPKAMPAMPAPAISGPRLMPRTPRTVNNPMRRMMTVMMLVSTAIRACTRCWFRAAFICAVCGRTGPLISVSDVMSCSSSCAARETRRLADERMMRLAMKTASSVRTITSKILRAGDAMSLSQSTKSFCESGSISSPA